MQYEFYVLSGLFAEYSQQTCYGGEKGNTFNQGRSQDHVCTNVVRSFRLTGNGFNSAFTDLTDTDTGTDSGEACANRTITRLYFQHDSHQRHDTWFL
jgi:hypothetical protein